MFDHAILRNSFNRIRGKIGWLYKGCRGEVDLNYMRNLRESESLSIDRLRKIQWLKLKKIIDHSYNTVPFYRARMDSIGIRPDDIQTSNDFLQFPRLTKKDLQERQKDLLSNRYSAASLVESWSGGSTGEPVRFCLDRRRIRWATTDEIWADEFSGWKIGEPIARLWGAPLTTAQVPFYRQLVRRHVLNPGFLVDAYELKHSTFMNFVSQYSRCRPTLIVGYSSALRELSLFILSEGLNLRPPKAIISSAELLDQNTKALIEEAFRCEVLDRYGSREMGLTASQCLKGQRYHVNMLRIYLELVDAKGATANPNVPLIRYEIGDRAKSSPSNGCECGRNFESLATIEGRTIDFLITSEGKKIHGLYFNLLILKFPEITQYRLVQESINSLQLQIVENNTITDKELNKLTSSVKIMIGENAHVRVERVKNIPKSKSGKLRYLECNVILER
jgi:phenylacetate-CoA ligase